MARKKIIAGNWKMNKTPEEAAELVRELVPLVADAEAEVVVCPPFVCLDAVRNGTRTRAVGGGCRGGSGGLPAVRMPGRRPQGSGRLQHQAGCAECAL